MLIAPLPKPYRQTDVLHGLRQWEELAQKQSDLSLANWMKETPNRTADRELLGALFGNSPYLARLLFLYPGIVRDVLSLGADKTYASMMQALAGIDLTGDKQKDLMPALRHAKGKLALLTAIADIAALWPLEKVTGALSEFADASISLALDFLLLSAQKRGEITLPDKTHPSQESGIIVLGMGKLGAYELNYSSDIDLILFFEPGKLQYQGRNNEQHFMNKLAHDLVHILQERTAEGYVFRTDLRLRPDPASMPPAITIDAAYYYYESVGQNWERAAMIKARAVAGDKQAGEVFLKNLAPFMWRRNLDFAAINDIHSIKRQMDSRQGKHLKVHGHNIKLGIGGIREIEFYVQIHQLIWGGRQPRLRTRATCESLLQLVELGLVEKETAATLITSYAFLRKLEHRLQMVADAQTHNLPNDDEGIAHMAAFMGYETTTQFSEEVLHHLNNVHEIYASSFKSAEGLGEEGNLVFTGVSHDPDTLQTLKQMGYAHPETVSEIVMGWHHGSSRATRSKRARELLTELMPTLLKRLAQTANPDAAFLRFNEFLMNLPAGVQLFSLFNANPHLLGLVSDIFGSAPTLADHLSKSPGLLDAVLYADFYNALPSLKQMGTQLEELLAVHPHFEERMDTLKQFRNEKQFQAGVQMLKHMITAAQAGKFLADLADLTIGHTLQMITADFEKTYGTIPDANFAVIALGKLGSREMTFSSDIDLVFVYDVPDFEAVSSGEKPFTASVYYNRLAQRFLNALSGMGRDGRLYEVDTRLRPSGKQGLLAVSTKGLEHYFQELAWTFEYMAFTKARVVAAGGGLDKQLEQFITRQLAKPHEPAKLLADVRDMRERIEKEHGTQNPWDIKYVRGGLMDIDFIAQYLLLKFSSGKPGSAGAIFSKLAQDGRLNTALADELIEADRFLGEIFNMLRLCSGHAFDESIALPGLKKLLGESVQEPSFSALKARLIAVEQSVLRHYNNLLAS